MRYWLILTCLTLGCAKVNTLNFKEHRFNKVPKKIIWIQIPGLDIEHIALEKFQYNDMKKTHVLEESSCVGLMWNYNIYDLRPGPANGLLSQVSGHQNIKGTCEDFDQRPVWNYLTQYDFKSIVLERSAAFTMSKALSCQSKKFFEKTSLFWMGSQSRKMEERFHFEKKITARPGVLQGDQTCKSKACLSSLKDNFSAIQASLLKDSSRFIFVIRDLSYWEAMQNKNLKQAKEVLFELSQLLKKIRSEFASSETSIIVSSTAANVFEFPKQGDTWLKLNRSAKNFTFKSSKLLSPVWSYGALSENFCGIFNESDLLSRMLKVNTKKKLTIMSLFD